MQAPKGRYNSILNCRVNMYIIAFTNLQIEKEKPHKPPMKMCVVVASLQEVVVVGVELQVKLLAGFY